MSLVISGHIMHSEHYACDQNSWLPTMTPIDAIYHRRSVREYAGIPLSREELLPLLEAAIQAPSAMNEQPWHFTIVRNEQLLDSISQKAKIHMMARYANTPDATRYRELLGRDDFHIFYHAPALIVISAPVDSLWATEDCALAAQNLMLAADAASLGTCWIGFAQNWLGTEEGKQIIGLPNTFLPVAPIIVGHPKSQSSAVPRNQPTIHWID
jgi:nitroreductase